MGNSHPDSQGQSESWAKQFMSKTKFGARLHACAIEHISSSSACKQMSICMERIVCADNVTAHEPISLTNAASHSEYG